MTLGCKNKGIRKTGFVAKTKFLIIYIKMQWYTNIFNSVHVNKRMLKELKYYNRNIFANCCYRDVSSRY